MIWNQTDRRVPGPNPLLRAPANVCLSSTGQLENRKFAHNHLFFSNKYVYCSLRSYTVLEALDKWSSILTTLLDSYCDFHFKVRKQRLREVKRVPKATQLKLTKPRFDSRLPEDITWALPLRKYFPTIFIISFSESSWMYPTNVCDQHDKGKHREQWFGPWRMAAKYVRAGKELWYLIWSGDSNTRQIHDT